jgi:CHAT domain-containing protein
MHLGIQESATAGRKQNPGCPGDDLLMEFAAGLCRAETAAQVLQHVAECGYCAPLLRIYLEDLPIPATEPISSQAGSTLASKTADGEEKVLRPIRPKSDSSTSRRSSLFSSFFKHRLVWAGGGLALAVAILVAGPVALNQYDLRRAQTLAAAAFGERRTTEMRFSWAPYSEWSLTRGEKPGSGSLSDRPNLVDAMGLANKHPDSSDPRWARANGRVYFLDGELQKASEFLKRSTEKGLNDPSTEIDLAVAYFQRAQEDQKLSNPEGKPIPPNLEEIIELLNKAASSPKATKNERATALFDLAIAYQRMLFWDMAAQTWEEYLKLESTGPWAEEARQRLEDAKKKIPPPRPQGYRTPGYFLHHSTDPDTQKSTEEYQDVALRSWLSDAMATKDTDALSALERLAGLLQEHHGDAWLHDFLQALKPGDLPAVNALRQALNSNRRGFSNDAAIAAETAASRFLRAGNRPGILMARFENLYAQHRALKQHACLKQARALEQDLLPTSYKWLQTQVALAEMLCYALGASFDSAEKQLKNARQIADAARFHILGLRVRVFEADLKRERAGCVQSWATVAEGLEQYWQGPALPVRLYEIYNRVGGCLIKQHRFWHAARSLQERLIVILERESDPADRSASIEASVHTSMENIFEELHEAKLAQGEAVIVAERQKQASQDYDKYELFIRIERAESQIETGDARGALDTLKQAQATFLNTDDDLIHLSFYRLLGDSYAAMKDSDQAEDAYQTSLQIAENGVGNLKEPGKRRQWINETGGVYRRIVGVLLDRKKYREALQFWEWYQNRSAFVEAGLATEAGIGSWSRIEKEVLSQPLPSPMSETRLVFAAIKDNLHVWVINKNGIETLWIPVKPVDLARMISEFSEKCSNPSSNVSDLEQKGRQLFNLLLQPVMAQVADSTVVVAELDQTMHGLLLEALKSPEGWYFGQKYSTIYSPGFLTEMQLRRSTGPIPDSGLLLDASASAGGPYPSLDRTEREALVQLFPRLEVLNGDQATPQKLRSILGESQVFFFIGHGNHDGLILNPGWVLKPEDLSSKSLQHLQLTVLAGCSTALVKNGLLDTNALVSTFLSGGVSNVVASHWEVNSQITGQFMASFYAGLKNGETASLSMRNARQRIFQTPSHRHPYFWAAFSLSGRMS